jgi:hypothetical protein
MRMSVYTPSKVHLLHWQAANCITLAETSRSERAKRVLNLLAVDLLLEAERTARRNSSGNRVRVDADPTTSLTAANRGLSGHGVRDDLGAGAVTG